MSEGIGKITKGLLKEEICNLDLACYKADKDSSLKLVYPHLMKALKELNKGYFLNKKLKITGKYCFFQLGLMELIFRIFIDIKDIPEGVENLPDWIIKLCKDKECMATPPEKLKDYFTNTVLDGAYFIVGTKEAVKMSFDRGDLFPGERAVIFRLNVCNYFMVPNTVEQVI